MALWAKFFRSLCELYQPIAAIDSSPGRQRWVTGSSRCESPFRHPDLVGKSSTVEEIGMRLNASVVPSLHHRKEGWMRHQEKCRAATESPQPGWFTSLSSIGKPPRPRYQRMLCDIFLARAATPPCGDARRGLSPTSIHHEFHRLRRSAPPS